MLLISRVWLDRFEEMRFKFQAEFLRLAQHPVAGTVAQSALAVAPADVAVRTGKPHLPDVDIWLVTPEHGCKVLAILVDGHCVTRVLNDYGRKQKYLKDGDKNLTGEDTREGLVGVVSVKLGEPQFEGQTKTRLGNPEVKGLVETAIADELSKYLEEHPSEGRKIIDKCVVTARAREAARKAKDLVVRKGLLDGSNLPGKLADCSDREPENWELYIVEGPSAGGSAKCRSR